MATTLKQELIDKISATEDENLLQLLKEDYDYFTKVGKPDITDELSYVDLEELKNLLKSLLVMKPNLMKILKRLLKDGVQNNSKKVYQ